ncbi:hypothetical protein H5200_04035 [Pseudoalteromonas sp. SG43-7]|uniref:hypothetical protein n=1 Tax=Pseudoalteromonas sp. SG43-7 TaxID=2760966 RepID=UPI00160151D6|nr:hypothetical protein [Pseudoalteromonas sp. SG43-7]MBB1421088.1 hypothetical protein [Pseudoalteromonas sp. SG43-7]
MAKYTLINGDVIEFSNNIVNSLACKGDQSQDRHGHIFFIPDEAVAFIDSGKLALDLFNLSKLALAKYDDSNPQLPVLIKHQTPLSQITGLSIKKLFKIAPFSSANIEKVKAASVFKQLLANSSIEYIQLDEVYSVC